VAEPLRNFGVGDRKERTERVEWLFSKVGLRPKAKKYPHEFSGGQRVRGFAQELHIRRGGGTTKSLRPD
jgi:peptide/nickel transport system ATP-binding protein